MRQDGTLNRQLLADAIFKDKSNKHALNQIMKWPLLFELILEILRTRNTGARIVLVDAPTLFESGMRPLFSVIMVVYTSREKQVERIMKRDMLSRADAESRIASQMDLGDKAALADFVIDNSCDNAKLLDSTSRVWAQIEELPHKKQSIFPIITRFTGLNIVFWVLSCAGAILDYAGLIKL